MVEHNATQRIYCLKCKKKTDNVNLSTVQASNGSWRKLAKCKVCNGQKSIFFKRGGKFKQIDVSTTDRQNEALELYKPTIKKFKKRKIVTLGIDDLWAADLIVMTSYSDENDGYKYMLNVIDTFSKYAWSEPLKKKDGATVANAFQKIITRAKSSEHSSPNLLHTDKGLEFKNKNFNSILEKYSIKLYHTENLEKSSIIERFNRTLNSKMKIYFYVNQNYRWIDILQNLIREYNHSYHRTIRTSPADVGKHNEDTILKLLGSQQSSMIRTDIEVGDRVRITKEKKTFGNKYGSNWTKEIFIVDKIVYTEPITYKLKALDGEEIIGSFYRKEILKAAM